MLRRNRQNKDIESNNNKILIEGGDYLINRQGKGRKMYYFDPTEVENWRKGLEKSLPGRCDNPSDLYWEKSKKDLMGIFNFTKIRIQKGYKLESYVRQGRNGYLTHVFAYPLSSKCPDPKRIKGANFEEILPKNGIADYMAVIEGEIDDPWSYIEASLFKRAITNHNGGWSSHPILAKHPSIDNTNTSQWSNLIYPSDWRPIVFFDDWSVYVQFYTYSSLWGETINRELDIYSDWNTKYTSRTEVTPIAFGTGGFML